MTFLRINHIFNHLVSCQMYGTVVQLYFVMTLYFKNAYAIVSGIVALKGLKYKEETNIFKENMNHSVKLHIYKI